MKRNLPLFGAVLVVAGACSLVYSVFSGGSGFPLFLVLGIVGIVLGILSVVFGLLVPVFERSAPPSDEVITAAADAGRLGTARVLTITRTGVRVNQRSEAAVRLIVVGTGHATYATSTHIRLDVPSLRLAPGHLITVVRPDADSPRVVMVKGPGETPQDQPVPTAADEWR
ncbi:MAG: hypothetical protein ABJB03_02185 [Rhodoglobus sp.]